MQERLSAAMDQDELQRVLKNAGILLDSAHALSVPVIVTEQYVKGLGPTVAALKEKAGNATFHEKISFSCCGNDDVMSQLRQTGRGQIVVCGMETHVCVQQTVLDLLHEGYVVHVVQDAVMSRAPANRATALEAMTLAGAVPTSTETVAFQWLKVAGTEVFKQVSKLVR
jgi:nicotinamidase-related amidase